MYYRIDLSVGAEHYLQGFSRLVSRCKHQY